MKQNSCSILYKMYNVLYLLLKTILTHQATVNPKITVLVIKTLQVSFASGF